MSWKCATCDRVFEIIPEDAVLLNRPGRSQHRVYRFMDGTIHSVRKVISAESIHHRWHDRFPKPDCEFCFPPPGPEPPVEQVELLQEVVQVLDELPEPQPELEIEPVETEVEEPTTSMAAAFHRLFKS